MPKIRTRPAILPESQTRSMLDGGRGVREVVVDGTVVGQYARNKYGVTIGHFSQVAMGGDDNPFVAAPLSHSVRPAGRTLGRTTAQLVADIARQPVCEYEREIQQAIANRKAA